ncbi:extracellular matrix protein, putative [Trichophyton benhamiae CBS 112371]|uniref:Extracellular matrix protein, putative n=1 Tax=Arthroderma benhamiae (strain ATCC MYA-4681 / CBS 112371) TaxID=663331 RepID=D4AQM9_ARTBC|nr:extracellular matrix protein, putative [Trichophyton benhamiae CBS 112371]EFE34773.1 extracellular matrix protein, putative [Trichophyton benhamiae CBS 112371]
MQLFQTLLAGAALIAAVAAERPAFTTFPKDPRVGEPITVTWAGGNPNARKKTDTNVITAQATGGSCTFTLPASLPSGPDYALQIKQGDETNYTGQFSITGGHGAPSSAPASTTTAAPSSSSSGEPSKPVTKPAVTSTPHASMTMSNSANHTTMTTMTSKPSSPTPSMGTATTTSDRNTTMSSQTLTSQSESATLTPSATPTGNAASLTALSSPLALIMAGLVAFAYLN